MSGMARKKVKRCLNHSNCKRMLNVETMKKISRSSRGATPNKLLTAPETQVMFTPALFIQAVGRERRFPQNIDRMEKRFKAGIGVPALTARISF
jgi:hypothetical protein